MIQEITFDPSTSFGTNLDRVMYADTDISVLNFIPGENNFALIALNA